jgi:hypothetical protein
MINLVDLLSDSDVGTPGASKPHLFVYLGIDRGWRELLQGVRCDRTRLLEGIPDFRPVRNAYLLDSEVRILFDSNHSNSLDVLEAGETLTFAQYYFWNGKQWFVTDPRLKETEDDPPCLHPKSKLEWRPKNKNDRLFMGAEDYQVHLTTLQGAAFDSLSRARVLDKTATEKDRAKAFFVGLELKTHLALMKGEVADAVWALLAFLPERTMHRAYNLADPPPADPKPLPPLHTESLQVIDRVFREVLEQSFHRTIARISKDEIANVVELFASGGLRTEFEPGRWVTQPTSGNFMFFCELALSILESLYPMPGPERSLWTNFAYAFAVSAEMFADVYFASKDPKEGFMCYRACAFNKHRAKRWTNQRRLRVRSKFALLPERDLPKLSAAVTRNLFPGFASARGLSQVSSRRRSR